MEPFGCSPETFHLSKLEMKDSKTMKVKKTMPNFTILFTILPLIREKNCRNTPPPPEHSEGNTTYLLILNGLCSLDILESDQACSCKLDLNVFFPPPCSLPLWCHCHSSPCMRSVTAPPTLSGMSSSRGADR